jgi:hypothetical protein
MIYDDLNPAEQELADQAGRDAAELVRAHMAHDHDRAQVILLRSHQDIVAQALAQLVASILTADEEVLRQVAARPGQFFLAWEKDFGKPPGEPE